MCTETILDPTHPCKLAAHTSVTPLHPHSVVSDELDKLAGLEPVSPEFNVTRTYLEWLTCLPWGVTSKEVFDVTHAQHVSYTLLTPPTNREVKIAGVALSVKIKYETICKFISARPLNTS